MVSGIAVASSVLAHDDGGIEVSYVRPPVKVEGRKKNFDDEVKHAWYKGRTALYMITIATALAIIVMVVAGVVGGGIMRAISEPRDATTPSGSTTEGDNQDTGTTSTSATSELTAPSAATTPSPTAPPTTFERTHPRKYKRQCPDCVLCRDLTRLRLQLHST